MALRQARPYVARVLCAVQTCVAVEDPSNHALSTEALVRSAQRSRFENVMRRLVLLLAVAASVAGCFSNDASGVVALRQYSVAPFNAVALSGEGQVFIAAGDYGVVVSAEADVLPSVRVEPDGDVLVLGRDVDWFDGIRATVPIQFRVTLPQLRAVSVSGSGSVALHRPPADGNLRVEIAGGSTADLTNMDAAQVEVTAQDAAVVRLAAVRADAVRFVLRGGARVTVAGVAEAVELDISGGGLFRGSGLQAQTVTAEVTGAGQAFVWAERDLEASVAGIGRIHYRGSPRVVEELQRDGQLLPLPPAA